MAIALNGSSQYVSLGNGVNVQSARPITLAALINTASLRTTGAWNGIYSQGDYSDRGWGIEIEAAASPRVYHTWVDGLGLHDNYSSWNIAANTGWWLIMVVFRDTGANSAVDFYGYRYNTSTLSQGTAGGGGANDADANAPGGSDPTVIGAFVDAGVIDHYPNNIGWVGVWGADLGEAAAANPKALWELIVRGPWGMLDSTCKLFQPFSNAAQDLSGNARHGTLQGSPSYVGSGPTEFAPALWVVPDVLSGGAPTLEQEGFRFRNDDGSESTATWRQAQDTDDSIATETPFRLRMLTNATGDPAIQAVKLQYRKVGASNWRDLGNA